MPNCIWCGKETALRVNGEPICVTCDDELAMRTTPWRREAQTEEQYEETPRATGGLDART
jgi:hypothetical protein